MLGNIVILAVLFALTLLTGWMVWRAWHVTRVALRWSATPLAGLLTALLALIVVLVGVGMVKAYAREGVPWWSGALRSRQSGSPVVNTSLG